MNGIGARVEDVAPTLQVGDLAVDRWCIFRMDNTIEMHLIITIRFLVNEFGGATGRWLFVWAPCLKVIVLEPGFGIVPIEPNRQAAVCLILGSANVQSPPVAALLGHQRLITMQHNATWFITDPRKD